MANRLTKNSKIKNYFEKNYINTDLGELESLIEKEKLNILIQNQAWLLDNVQWHQ